MVVRVPLFRIQMLLTIAIALHLKYGIHVRSITKTISNA